LGQWGKGEGGDKSGPPRESDNRSHSDSDVNPHPLVAALSSPRQEHRTGNRSSQRVLGSLGLRPSSRKGENA
jgi:hypothetical protein